MWRAERDGPGHDPSLTVTRPLDPGRADTIVHSGRGEPFRACPETGGRRNMAFEGSGRDRETLKCRCPAAAYGSGCAGRASCRRMGGGRAGDHRRVVRIPPGDADTDRRVFTPVPWGSPSRKRGCSRRSAPERVSSRIDRVHGMETRFVRGRTEMALRRSLAVAVMTATAPGHVRAGRPEMMRSPVRGPDLKAAWDPNPTARKPCRTRRRAPRHAWDSVRDGARDAEGRFRAPKQPAGPGFRCAGRVGSRRCRQKTLQRKRLPWSDSGQRS